MSSNTGATSYRTMGNDDLIEEYHRLRNNYTGRNPSLSAVTKELRNRDYYLEDYWPISMSEVDCMDWWKGKTAEEKEDLLQKLNKELNNHGITDVKSVAMFMAIATRESGYGNKLVQNEYEYSGGGYLQVTGENNYDAFYKDENIDVSAKRSTENHTEFVAREYPEKSAAWYWASAARVSNSSSINSYIIEKQAESTDEGIYFAVCNFVGGYPKTAIENSGRKIIFEGKEKNATEEDKKKRGDAITAVRENPALLQGIKDEDENGITDGIYVLDYNGVKYDLSFNFDARMGHLKEGKKCFGID